MTCEKYCDELKRLAEAKYNALDQDEIDFIEKEERRLENDYWSYDNPDNDLNESTIRLQEIQLTLDALYKEEDQSSFAICAAITLLLQEQRQLVEKIESR